MSKQATGIVCRLCSRLIEADSTLTYVTCVLCSEALPVAFRQRQRAEAPGRLTA